MAVQRIDADAARARVAHDRALLVCAYDDLDKCRANHVEGAIAWPVLAKELPRLAPDHPIILYCG